MEKAELELVTIIDNWKDNDESSSKLMNYLL